MSSDEIIIKLKNKCFQNSVKNFYEYLNNYFVNEIKTNTKFDFNYEEFKLQSIKTFKEELKCLPQNSNEILKDFLKIIDKKVAQLESNVTFANNFKGLLDKQLDQEEFIENEKIAFILFEILNSMFSQLYDIEDKELIETMILIHNNFKNINQDHLRSLHTEHKIYFDESVRYYSGKFKTSQKISEQEHSIAVSTSLTLFRSGVKNLDKKYKKLSDEFETKLETQLNSRLKNYGEICDKFVEFVTNIFKNRFETAFESKQYDLEQLKNVHKILGNFCYETLRDKCFADENLNRFSNKCLKDFELLVENHFKETFDEKPKVMKTNIEIYCNEINSYLDKNELTFDLRTEHEKVKKCLSQKLRGNELSIKIMNDSIEEKYNEYKMILDSNKIILGILDKEDFIEPSNLKAMCKQHFKTHLEQIKKDDIAFQFLKMFIQVIQRIKVENSVKQNNKIINDFVVKVSNEFTKKLKSEFLDENQMKQIFADISIELNFDSVLNDLPLMHQDILKNNLNEFYGKISEQYLSWYKELKSISKIIVNESTEICRNYFYENINKFSTVEEFDKFRKTIILNANKALEDRLLVFEQKFDSKLINEINKIIETVICDLIDNQRPTASSIIDDKLIVKQPIAPPRLKRNLKAEVASKIKCDINGWIAVHFTPHRLDSVCIDTNIEDICQMNWKNQLSADLPKINLIKPNDLKQFETIMTSKMSECFKQYENVKNAVLTVHSDFKLRERMIIKSIVKNTDNIKSVHILSELYSAAIGYGFGPKYKQKDCSKHVFIIVDYKSGFCGGIFYINDYLIDCTFIIEQECHKPIVATDYYQNEQNLKCFIEYVIEMKKHFEEILIISNSPLISSIKGIVTQMFDSKFIFNLDPNEVITTGSVIYGLKLVKKIYDFKIMNRVSFPLKYVLTSTRSKVSGTLIHKDQQFDYELYTKAFSEHFHFDLPLTLEVLEEKDENTEIRIMCLQIDVLPLPLTKDTWLNIIFKIEEMSNIEFKIDQENKSSPGDKSSEIAEVKTRVVTKITN